MRKVSYLLLITVIAVFLTSCKGEKGDPGINVEWYVDDIKVPASSWQYVYANNGGYYRYVCDVPALTHNVLINGSINAYIYLPGEFLEGDIQRPLPYSCPNMLHDDNDYTFTEHYDYVFGIGWIEFQYCASDFLYDQQSEYITEFAPSEQVFRIVLQW
ncbi:MAG: hypothetical protein KBS40_05395 [Bacteroidales bacterium]|nr:hypothetical protein [Bacteroidales bacterium]